MAEIKSFRDLKVYRAAREQAQEIFDISKRFPKEETYALTDQIRRSSRAVGAMLAEAWGRRRYPAAFSSKVSEAMGEAAETQAWLDHAQACGYLSPEQYQTLCGAWDEISAMLCGIAKRSETFCRQTSKWG